MGRLESVFSLGIILAAVGGCGGGSSTDSGANSLPDAVGDVATGGSTNTTVGSGGIVTGGNSGTAVGSGGVATGGGGGTTSGTGGVATGGGAGGTSRTGGSGGNLPTGGAGGSSAGGSSAGGSSGTATGGSSGGTGACNYPTCLSDLLSPCVPDGTCVHQGGLTYQGGSTTDPAMIDNFCYSNGVRVLNTDYGGSARTIVKKNGTTCFTQEDYSIIRGPTGTVVATCVTDYIANTATITCVGGSPVVVSLDCMPITNFGGAVGAGCTDGTCS